MKSNLQKQVFEKLKDVLLLRNNRYDNSRSNIFCIFCSILYQKSGLLKKFVLVYSIMKEIVEGCHISAKDVIEKSKLIKNYF